MIKVLFVCTGNICRSPTAEGVFRHLASAAGLGDRIAAGSAGLHDYHVGEPPDSRSIAVARARGYRLEQIRARKFRPQDYHDYQMILAMAEEHHRELVSRAPPDRRDRVERFLHFAGANHRHHRGVPDPYYGGPDGFETVLDQIEDGCRGLLAVLARRLEDAADPSGDRR